MNRREFLEKSIQVTAALAALPLVTETREPKRFDFRTVRAKGKPITGQFCTVDKSTKLRIIGEPVIFPRYKS